jgi:hypothetical protein
MSISKIIVVWVTGIVLISASASAQKHERTWSSAKSGSTSSSASNKPLTPKTAIAPHKTSSSLPGGATSGVRRNNQELAHLERQGVPAGSSKNASTKALKVGPAKATSGSNSGINSSYQKPRIPNK